MVDGGATTDHVGDVVGRELADVLLDVEHLLDRLVQIAPAAGVDVLVQAKQAHADHLLEVVQEEQLAAVLGGEGPEVVP